VGIVAVYQALILTPVLITSARHPLVFLAACYFSFLNAVVIHNHLHKGVFHSKRLNKAFRFLLSFGALYPASANIPSHNLVHHHFEEDGQPDWAAPGHVRFRWNFLNLLHFPNVVGPNTFTGVKRWSDVTRHPGFVFQYNAETVFAFAVTGLLLWVNFWPTIAFVVLPQFYGARCILRINLIQHDACDVDSEWNHSRNFVGRGFNWIMCNNGYHTIHHNRAGMHWVDLAHAHREQVVPRMDPRLDEPSMIRYLLRAFVLHVHRESNVPGRGHEEERHLGRPSRLERYAAADDAAMREAGGRAT
jgi:fatty acid desaturase